MLNRIYNKVLQICEEIYFKYYSYIIEKNIENYKVKLIINDRFAKYWYKQNIWNELKYIGKMIHKYDIIADCGANIGFTSIYFAKKAFKGEVYSFEALPKNADTLKANKELNKIDNLFVVEKALSNEKVDCFFTNYGNGIRLKSPKNEHIKIEAITLDEYFESIQQSPNLLKIDVEGMEFEVLEGAKNILHKKPKLAIEVHLAFYEDKSMEFKKLLDLLLCHDYKDCYWEIQDEEKIIGSTLIDLKKNALSICKYEIIHLFLNK